eukprot:6342151-Pyramimonas_sp.AAC.1
MRRQWEQLLGTTAETLHPLGPPAHWSGLGCSDEAKWRTVLSAICWGTCTVQLDEHMRQVFTRARIAHRLFAPFQAYWARHPQTLDTGVPAAPFSTLTTAVIEGILAVASGNSPDSSPSRLRSVDPTWPNLRGEPTLGSPPEPPQAAGAATPLAPQQRGTCAPGQQRPQARSA